MLGREPGGSEAVQFVFVIRPRVPVREEHGFDVPLSELGQRASELSINSGMSASPVSYESCVAASVCYEPYSTPALPTAQPPPYVTI